MVSTTIDQVARTADGIPLKVKLQRAERKRKLRAIGLVLPLFLFIVISFVIPIAVMLFNAVHDPEGIAKLMPNTTAAVADWDGQDLPPEEAYAALVADLKVAQVEKTPVAAIGKRLNYEMSGIRSKVIATGRAVVKLESGPYKEKLIEINPVWGERMTWLVIQRNSRTFTPYYLLNALDYRYNENNEIRHRPANESIYKDIFLRTISISIMVTAATLLLGFPVAYLLATLPLKTSNLLMIMVLLPFWTSLLVRTTAWVVLLQTEGVINDFMVWIGIFQERIQLIFNRGGTLVAMTHIQLPFTLLPIYSVMKTISPSHVRAARSLGAGQFYAFWRVYFPQTIPGIAAGSLLTFILSLGYYITPALVGGPKDQMISYFVALYTNREVNWGMASALGGILLIATLALYFVYNKLIGVDRMKLG
jgi:putative spermidine/putrescine transport system permease protein